MSKWKQAAILLCFFGGLCLSACGKDETEQNLPDIEQEIAEYRMNFIELYTNTAMEETESQIYIEEMEIGFGDNGEPATLIKYTDSSGEELRYQLQFYGETGQCSIDYYLCKDFVLISRKNDYYSSWVLTAGYSDVLYSTIENWIVVDENTYILHSDGDLEEIEKTQLNIPMLEEIEKFAQNEGPRVEPSVYQDLLVEYERVMKDESYMEEEWSNNIYDHVKRHIGKTQLSYCIKDLAGDGKSELILGVFRHERYKILGTIYESEYEPFIIYTYDDEGIHWNCISEEYIMTIYKDGIVEFISGGQWQHFMYKQVEKNEVYEKNMDIIVCAQADDEEADYYKYEIDGDEYEDITEEEFYNIRNQYTAVREELEWRPVEGFWNAENLE